MISETADTESISAIVKGRRMTCSVVIMVDSCDPFANESSVYLASCGGRYRTPSHSKTGVALLQKPFTREGLAKKTQKVLGTSDGITDKYREACQ